MARKTREEAENTKEMILESALDCFYEKGFSSTTFDDIASRINLTKGAVYWHFKNKTELLVVIIQQAINEKIKKINSCHCNPKGLSDLRNFFIYQAKQMEENEELKKFIFFITFQVEWSDAIFKKVAKKVIQIEEFHMKTIKEALTFAQKHGEISSSVDIDTIVLLIMSTWRGLVNIYISKQIEFGLSDTFVKGLDIILNGIKTTKGIIK